MTPTEELKAIITKQNKIVAEVATNLYSDLVTHTPVDTGNLKGSWSIEKQGDIYIITNSSEYAEIRLSPYMEGGKYGSLKFPLGANVYIDKWNRILKERLRSI